MLEDRSESTTRARPVGRAAAGSVAIHAGLLVLLGLLARHASDESGVDLAPRPHRESLVYLAMPGPTGGGGGGGTRSTAPPRTAEAPGPDRVTVPAARPRAQTLRAPEPAPVPQLTLAAIPLAAGATTMAGVIEPVPSASPDSLGLGDGGGAGRGAGRGIGPGAGTGLDDGAGGSSGGETYRAGNGVTAPRLLRTVRPQYTPDAMRSRITGTVVLDCIVDMNGNVQRCRLQRSLDSRHGLDEEAIKAAHQWSFAPGTRLGQPVPVYVTIELSFSIQ